jgi:hypothetical protein
MFFDYLPPWSMLAKCCREVMLRRKIAGGGGRELVWSMIKVKGWCFPPQSLYGMEKKWCYTFQPTQFRVSLFLDDSKGGLMVGRCVPYGIEIYQDRQIRLLNHVIKGGEGLLSCMHLISYRITRSINMLQVTQHLWTRNSFYSLEVWHLS